MIILKHISPNKTVMWLGDDGQSIYSNSSNIFSKKGKGGDGIDTCNYNGDEVDADMWYYGDPDEIDGYIRNPIFSCENL